MKLVTLSKGALSDIAYLSRASLFLQGKYTLGVEPLLVDGSTNVIDQAQSTVQRARVLLSFIREVS